MIDHEAMRLAMRAHALTLSVCTTGAVTLAATATGYTRSTGSFLTDGLAAGMEITPAGFAANPLSTIKSVTATAVVVEDARSVEAAAAGRSLTVLLPSRRAYENLTFEPLAKHPYVIEQYLPGAPPRKITLGSTGLIELTPMYALAICTPANAGILAPTRYADALLNHFKPETALTLANGDVLQVRGDTGPFAGQLLQREPGWATLPTTVPFRLRTANAA